MNKIFIIDSRRIILALAVILSAIFLIACEFESKETWFNDIPEPEGEIPTAELNFKDSVIIIEQATIFTYSLSFIKQEIYEVEFYLNGVKFASKKESKGSLNINPPAGVHRFKMMVYTSTASGSIADQVGAEIFSYSQNWTLYVEDTGDPEDPEEDPGWSNIQITAINKEEGSLRIEWERYQGYMFQSYEIIKRTLQGDIILYSSTDVDLTSFFDRYFVGGSAEYFIRFHKTAGPPVDGTSKLFAAVPNIFNLNLDAEHNLTITWSPCEFETNFGTYRLSQKLNDGPSEVIFETSTLNDTTLTIPIGPHQNFQFELGYHSKKQAPAPWYRVYTIGEHFSTGFLFLPSCEVIAQSKTPPFRIYTPEYFYDVIEDKLIYRALAEHNGLFDVSDNNFEHISGLSHYRGDGEGWYFFGLYNQLSNIPLSVFENEERRACISDYSQILIESGRSVYLHHKTPAGAEVLHFENDSLHWSVLSSHGHYVIATDLENSEIDFYYHYPDWIDGVWYYYFVWINTLDGIAGNYVFKNNNEFAMIWGNKLEIHSCELMNPRFGIGDDLLLSTETSATRVVETDPISNTLLACSSDRLFVYDLTDLSLLGEIPNSIVFQKVIQHGPQQVAYLNSTVFYMEDGASETTMLMLPVADWR